MSSVWSALARALSPVEDRPRVAPDIESACYTTRSGTPYVVIHNPATRSYARLDPREYELLALMDGQRSVKELVIEYYQRHGTLALARVAGLVRLLREQRFLVGEAIDAYAVLSTRLNGTRPAVRGPELTVDRIDGLFARLYSAWGRYFFRPLWFWVGVALGVIGPVLVGLELTRGRYTIFEMGGSALAAVVVLVAMALIALAVHELGHGLAVKHAGRRVHEAGVRLYFGFPAAYVDTTDVWMASPGQRMLTAFAGPWTGLVLGGLLAILVEAVATGALGAVLFTAAFVFLVDNLFNFNPLLELDGYYILIDFLDRPLLRARSLAFVRGPLWSRLWRRQGLSAEERLFTLFGLCAVAYGVLAIAVALRAWEGLLLPLVVSSLRSGDVLQQLGGTLVVLAVVVLVAATIIAYLRRLLPSAAQLMAWLGGRAAERRYREALTALRAAPLWAEVPAPRLLELARAMRAENVRRGDEIVRQGEAGDRFYLIADGAFEVLVNDEAQVRLGRGDYFGERALLHRAPRAATVVAVEPGRVFVLDHADFDRLLADDLTVRARLEAALAYRDAVAQMPLFDDLSPGELDVLLARLVPLDATPGQRIVQQGERGERFYVVRTGTVEVERDGSVLARLGPGEAFGEIALLLDVPRTATVTAVEPTTLLALDAPDFRDLLASYLGRAGVLERLSHLRLRTHKRLDEVV